MKKKLTPKEEQRVEELLKLIDFYDERIKKASEEVQKILGISDLVNPKNNHRRWTKEEEEIVKNDFYNGISVEETAQKLNRSILSVTQRQNKVLFDIE